MGRAPAAASASPLARPKGLPAEFNSASLPYYPARLHCCPQQFLLGLFAGGWTEQMVIENYPHLTPEAIHAAFAFAAACMQDTTFYALPVS